MGGGSVKEITDNDHDTKIEVEQSADEDKVRVTTAGTQRALIDSNGLALQSGTDVNEFSTDGTLGGNSDDAVPTEKAVKTYVDTHAPIAAFLVRPTSSQLDIAPGSAVTIIFGTEIFDDGSNFANNVFTAPLTGRYHFSISIYGTNFDTATWTQLNLVTSNRGYLFTDGPEVTLAADNTLVIGFSVLADMDAGDTARVTIEQGGGTAQNDIHPASCFSGFLI